MMEEFFQLRIVLEVSAAITGKWEFFREGCSFERGESHVPILDPGSSRMIHAVKGRYESVRQSV